MGVKMTNKTQGGMPGFVYSNATVSNLGREEDKTLLRQKLDAGNLDEIEFSILAFRAQYPNRNFCRFRDEDLAGFADSFKGQPFLRDHDLQHIDSRDGTIVDSKLDGDGFIQTVKLTTERGMRSYIEGQMDRFSIGWYYDGITCSICSENWFQCRHWPGVEYHDGKGDSLGHCELIFESPRGKETSAVNAPAVEGTQALAELCSCKEVLNKEHSKMEENEVKTEKKEAQGVGGADDVSPSATGSDEWSDLLREQAIGVALTNSGLTLAGQDAVVSGLNDSVVTVERLKTLIDAQKEVESALISSNPVKGVEPITEGDMRTALDEVSSAVEWLFGGETETPKPHLRSIRDVYLAVTGDIDFYGQFNKDYAKLAAANTTTMSGLATDALNKVVMLHYDNQLTYRWYEAITHVVPHDGSTHDVELLLVDGIQNLPTVSEGAAYTEAPAGDSQETATFSKKGQYVGITLEMIRRSDIARIQAIPRNLVTASVRTRSAAIANFFTQASGVGPTLAQDSKALFHTDHGNLGTAAFGSAEWGAARKRIWGQTIPGSAGSLGLWPTFCLLPIDLYDTALTQFGYGSGDVGKPTTAGTAQEVNPYGGSRPGDPRPIPVAVPEFTDANDWAYIVDPRLHPVICMAYANSPQGNIHPVPEVFQVTSETAGLMFTNDTLPVKIRDWWAAGVGTYIGVGKNNVA